MQKIRCVVKSVVWQNDRNGFSILKVAVDDRLGIQTLLCNCLSMAKGTELDELILAYAGQENLYSHRFSPCLGDSCFYRTVPVQEYTSERKIAVQYFLKNHFRSFFLSIKVYLI